MSPKIDKNEILRGQISFLSILGQKMVNLQNRPTGTRDPLFERIFITYSENEVGKFEK